MRVLSGDPTHQGAATSQILLFMKIFWFMPFPFFLFSHCFC